ncbi:MAG: RsmF rRNA methyltransferase first C-terminal domain-containing protein [Eubacterium sp.]|nr:RsmF rRNA methyltransferase first C-terminal domain-containing protein [Eubacterium sp.]
MLPQDFLERMQKDLKEDFNDFLQGYEKPSYKSLRVNTLKTYEDFHEKVHDWELEPVPWCPEGYYYNKDLQPGKHPYHEAGVYYIQEASAMLPAVLLDAQPGETVLDLCAAPGGKSTEIASAMKGEGILFCNEIIPNRAKILSENIERMGIKNAIVTNNDSHTLAAKFPEHFHRIMVDAPCSGEGMFRKNSDACEEWSLENVKICGERQLEILENAAIMLKTGGRIVYSTCTFAPIENEGTVCSFLNNHPEFSLVTPKIFLEEFDCGHKDWIESPDSLPIDYSKCIRLWPHRLKGEGHFVAVFEKHGEPEDVRKVKAEKGIHPKELKEFLSFEKNFLNTKLEGTFIKFGEQLYLLPDNTPSLKGIKVLRPGLHLGTFLKNRFEPSHALALALSPEEVRFVTNINLDTARTYLGGQTFSAEGEKGWHQITVEGYPLGWGKLAGGIMKNHYPKGLRKNWL